MNRLTNTLEELKNKSKKALVAYLVAGDPDIAVSYTHLPSPRDGLLSRMPSSA